MCLAKQTVHIHIVFVRVCCVLCVYVYDTVGRHMIIMLYYDDAIYTTLEPD